MKNSQTIWVGLSFLAVGLAVGLLYGDFASNGEANINIRAAESEQNEYLAPEPKFVAVSTDDDAILGDPNAPITIVEFSDFECPFCARFSEDVLPALKENYIDTGLVKLVYRDFPLNSHVNAHIAAEAAECVGEESDELYYTMHDRLFADPARWRTSNAAEELIGMANDLGVDIRSCLENGDMVAEVDADFAAARSYGVSGTPTLFINGQMIVGAQPYEVFNEIIQSELE
jgi:protein-disulfide isomerase